MLGVPSGSAAYRASPPYRTLPLRRGIAACGRQGRELGRQSSIRSARLRAHCVRLSRALARITAALFRLPPFRPSRRWRRARGSARRVVGPEWGQNGSAEIGAQQVLAPQTAHASNNQRARGADKEEDQCHANKKKLGMDRHQQWRRQDTRPNCSWRGSAAKGAAHLLGGHSAAYAPAAAELLLP